MILAKMCRTHQILNNLVNVKIKSFPPNLINVVSLGQGGDIL